jgi:hypothetical protein
MNQNNRGVMKRKIHSMAILVLVAMSCLSVSANANAAAYTFSVDYFSVTGNLPGSIVDDFNDGNINPLWDIYEPTVIEAGSTVSFSNPGTIVSPVQIGTLGNISSEMSYIGSSSSLQMLNNSGDFLGTSTWTASVPGSNQFYVMGINDIAADEDISIGVYNFDSSFASAFGVPQGLGVFFGRFGDVGIGDFTSQGVSILPTDITGDILLSLAFTDATDMFSAAYSLDGGASFLTPYTSIASTSGTQEFGWFLGAESFTVPIPGAIWLFGSGLLGLIGIARSKKTTA